MSAHSDSVVVATAQYPWMQPGDPDPSHSTSYGRRSIVVPGHIEEVVSNVCADPLPEIGRWRSEEGRFWKRFELPSADWQGGSGSQTAELTLIGQGIRSYPSEVLLAPALPRPSIDLADEPDELLAAPNPVAATLDEARLRYCETVEMMADNHVEYINDLYDHQRPHRQYWEENFDGAALRSVRRSLARWRRSGARDEARLALIVKLAEQLPPVLQDVCRRPRVVLRRVRQMLSVGRVQEADASCLRWLARQPGRNVVEKAGTRQQVLGIARVEDADTPENRVVRDLLIRAIIECRRYLSENHQYSNHARVLAVRRFRSLLHQLRYGSAVGHVSPLVGVAQPNYVLQHEPRYRQLWEAYLLLVHQQKQKEDIWRWRERTWAEVCGLALWRLMQRLGARGSAFRSDVSFRDEQSAGKFFDPQMAVASWDLARRPMQARVSIVEGSLLVRHAAIPPALRSLSPSFMLVIHPYKNTDQPRPWLAIWTLLEANSGDTTFEDALERLERGIERIQAMSPVQGILLAPRLDDNPAREVERRAHLTIVRPRLPLMTDDVLPRVVMQKWHLH